MNSSQLTCWSIGSHRKIIVGLLALIGRLFSYWKTSRILVLEHHRENFIAAQNSSAAYSVLSDQSQTYVRISFTLGQLKLKT
ncbi:hypothetical protein H4Q26_008846 [Puccinia striiformis f. sp. tritici PST-130]|nr:hypothetical protein H4Q26_008846 [Puccinia striiformis f. sp. tritici PST-130]